MRLLLTSWLLAGCTPGATIIVDGDHGVASLDTGPTDDTGIDSGDTASDADVESVPGVLDPSDALFSLERVHMLDITLGRALRDTLDADPYTYVETDVVFDDISLSGVGVRLKGRYGSYRNLSGKAGFKIDVNRFNEGQTLYGLTHLNINNLVQDGAQLHDRVAYNAYRAAGVPAPRVGYVWVIVDGEDYGLYGLIEDYDEAFLEENFDDPSGNLYDGDYWLADDWSWYVLIDFNTSSQDYFDQDAGTDVGLADIYAITDTISQSCHGQDFDESMDVVMDFDHWLSFWAMEIWVGQWDGYNYNSNNYRVYFDPGRDGRAIMMPWDHDQPFYEDLWIDDPVGVLGSCCKVDLGCRQKLYEAIDQVCLDVADAGLVEDLQATAELINPYVLEDPRKEITYDTALYYQDHTEAWLGDRCDELDLWGGFGP